MVLMKLISWGVEGGYLSLEKIVYKDMNKEVEGRDRNEIDVFF